MVEVYVFEGGENVGEDNIMVVGEWNQEELIKILSLGNEDIANNVDTTDMFESETPVYIQDTFSFVGSNMAQIVTNAEDGGMTYVVRK